ncbi:hypothetical protein JOD43_000030 [Pullulanibacillus pueri]|uniref:PD-(D/E)XK nuclease superfamily protein n=1 Tax=Pullulanibacillus pueri TaxID=1437324 RepID=A0A8J2ZRP2_9BACL|nr:PD-(D/E)XK nuclease family protein [Pullulanibacillus pueri]MBM7679871.1 hypothetical protein [Pullulanibacillus pueri]GGH73255.1 hypothetical protein GCM10007096_00300 [Pullulanibacillus pueri]
MNIFDALNIFYREDTISDFLINCFRNSKEFLIRFLIEANIKVPGDSIFEIKGRVGLGKSIGTPDIVILAKSDSSIHFIIVENKMGAAEGHEQTNRYESEEAKKRFVKKYGIDKEKMDNIEFHFVFLALDTTAKPKNSQFTFLNYDRFLVGEWSLNEETLQVIFRDFQNKLQSFYKPLMEPLNTLQSDIGLEPIQRKICWQSILFAAFSQYPELLLDWGEVGGAGRNNFLFLISKPNWTSEQSYHDVGLAQTFNIHIDTYINMLDTRGSNGVDEIGIRFESFPYTPHSKIDNLNGYQKFKEKKDIFGEKLFKAAKQNGIVAKRKNTKLLVMTIPIHAPTIRDTVQNMIKKVRAIEECIDKVLIDMKSEDLIK